MGPYIITHFRLTLNGTRRTIAEKITVDTIQELELLRTHLKAKFNASWCDFVYIVKG